MRAKIEAVPGVLKVEREDGRRSRDGIGALFDMDWTLLRGSSGMLYLRYLREIGYLPWREWTRVLTLVAQYAIGATDFPRMMGRLMSQVAGSSEEEAWRISGEWFEAMLRRYIADAARERVGWHQDQGHHVVIVSASTPYAVRPVAHALGLGDSFLATQLEVADGAFTGAVLEPACYGVGKRQLAEAFAKENGFDLAESYFYTDSHEDLPLMLAVKHPVAVNPNRKLKRIATDRSWPIVYFY